MITKIASTWQSGRATFVACDDCGRCGRQWLISTLRSSAWSHSAAAAGTARFGLHDRWFTPPANLLPPFRELDLPARSGGLSCDGRAEARPSEVTAAAATTQAGTIPGIPRYISSSAVSRLVVKGAKRSARKPLSIPWALSSPLISQR